MFVLRVRNPVTRRFRSLTQISRGLTRLEVLLVFSVILLNAAILLPFMQQAREAARRSECKRNLNQIGLAISNYVDVYECFPAGFDVSSEGIYPGWGWNLKILPQLNAADLYARIEPHLAAGIHGLPEIPEFERRWSILSCPSNPGSETVPHAMIVSTKVVDGNVHAASEDWQSRLPISSYFGNAGYLQLEAGGIQYNAAGIPTSVIPLVNAGSLGHFGTNRSVENQYCDQENFGGFFGQNSHVLLRNVIDGTSNAFMLGERYSPLDSSASAVGYGTWLGVPDCTRAQGLAMALGDASVRINIGMPLRESTTGFGSMHTGGAFFVFGDGNVRFISQKIDIAVFRNLSVIDDSKR